MTDYSEYTTKLVILVTKLGNALRNKDYDKAFNLNNEIISCANGINRYILSIDKGGKNDN